MQIPDTFMCKLACHRKRINFMPANECDGRTFTEHEAKAEIIYSYYNEVLGKNITREHRIDIGSLDIPQLDLSGLDVGFYVDEVWNIVKETPSNRAPGPDGFTGLFYRAAWEVIKDDVMAAVNAIWALDSRSYHLLNDALMILLPKTHNPTKLKDFRPISLMHSFGKLLSKGLALRLAPRLADIVCAN